jgi:hypothetical protein
VNTSKEREYGMKTYFMVADSLPKTSDNWFDGFGDFVEFEAEDLEAAQNWLNEQCV